DPDFTLGRAGADLEADTRRVAKALPRLQRGRIQEAAAAFAAQSPDVERWIRHMHRMAARAALLVSDAVLPPVDALGSPLAPANTATDLAFFWISDPAMRVWRAVAQQL